MQHRDKSVLALQIVFDLMKGQYASALQSLRLQAGKPEPLDLLPAALALEGLLGGHTLPYETYWGIVYAVKRAREGGTSTGSWAALCLAILDAFQVEARLGLETLVAKLQIEGVDSERLQETARLLDAIFTA